MRYILFTLAFLLSANVYSQDSQKIIVNDVEINQDSTLQYIKIVGGSLFKRVWITVDYGQPYKIGDSTVIQDENGKTIKFESMMAALNWFYQRGWEFLDAYPVTSSQGGAVYHFVLQRQKTP